MKQFLITIAGVLVGLILFLFIGPMILFASLSGMAKNSQAELSPAAVVLELDLRGGLTDSPSTSPFAFERNRSVVELVRTLEGAANDKKVKGLFIRTGAAGLSPAHGEELEDAFRRFQSSGRWIITSIQNESVRTSLPVYAAVAGSDELWLHGASEFMPVGLVSERTYFGGTLDRFKITAQFEAREEFKSGPRAWIAEGPTPADAESLNSLLTDIYDRLTLVALEGRKPRTETKPPAERMTLESLKAAFEASPFSGEEALRRGLIDKLGTPEEAEAAAIDRAGGVGTAGLVPIQHYQPSPPSGPVIALVSGEGAMFTGPDDPSLFGDSVAMYSDVVARALLDAAADEDVEAIVFRVSSPGGSAVAADQIGRAVEAVRKRGKKVVISMGAEAASGGYWIAAGADEIVAQPTTITGSIGIYGGKFATEAALEHYLSARTHTAQVGSPAANWFSATQPFTQAERAAFSEFIDRGYQKFLGHVADGRGLTPDDVRAVAKGRVWTGAEAKQRKLVDSIGGLDAAIERAKALAGVPAESKVALRLYPEQLTPFEALGRIFGGSAEAARAAAVLGALAGDETLGAYIDEARRARSGSLQAHDSVVVR